MGDIWAKVMRMSQPGRFLPWHGSCELGETMKNKPLMLALTSAAVWFLGLAALPVSAQPVPPPMADYQPLSDQQLDQLLGPIALYADPLLAQILPAATLPTQIVLADRYVTGGGDPGQIDQQPWDASVQAVARYPAVLQYLDDNLDWTAALGQAFLNQQQQVMETIQRLRISARNFGNLVSTPQQQVVDDNGYIEILPVAPDLVYVPVYQPDYVYVQGGYGLGFGAVCSLGPWLNCDFDWQHQHVYSWDRDHGHPANWWRERPEQRTAWMAHQGTVWRPEDHREAGHSLIVGNRGDRGYPPVHAEPAHHGMVVNQSKPSAVPRPAATPRPAAEPRPAAVRESGAIHVAEHPAAPAAHAPSNGAFIGSESSHAAKAFSDRGQESMRNVPRSEPAHAAPPAPASHSAPSGGGGGGGGGGGSHGSGSKH